MRCKINIGELAGSLTLAAVARTVLIITAIRQPNSDENYIHNSSTLAIRKI